MQDQQVIQLLKNQDKAAISELYDNYGSALYGIIYRIVQSNSLAQQVLQDTFVKVWRYGAQYDISKGRLFTWLLNIARNTAIDATRTAHFQHARKTDSIETPGFSIGTYDYNPDHIGLREIVNKMDDKYKNVIELVYFGGYTQEEVAEKTGIPLGTVKTRLRSAISALRSAFE